MNVARILGTMCLAMMMWQTPPDARVASADEPAGQVDEGRDEGRRETPPEARDRRQDGDGERGEERARDGEGDRPAQRGRAGEGFRRGPRDGSGQGPGGPGRGRFGGRGGFSGGFGPPWARQGRDENGPPEGRGPRGMNVRDRDEERPERPEVGDAPRRRPTRPDGDVDRPRGQRRGPGPEAARRRDFEGRPRGAREEQARGRGGRDRGPERGMRMAQRGGPEWGPGRGRPMGPGQMRPEWRRGPGWGGPPAAMQRGPNASGRAAMQSLQRDLRRLTEAISELTERIEKLEVRD